MLEKHTQHQKINYKNFFKLVIEHSQAKVWEEAIFEWEIHEKYDNVISNAHCICGHENIRYVFVIKNKITLKELKLGAACLKKFGRIEFEEYAKIYEKEFKLFNAIKNKHLIKINRDFFSRKLIKSFLDRGILTEKDYDFMIDMFNKRHKERITEKQDKYLSDLIEFKIFPYLVKEISMVNAVI